MSFNASRFGRRQLFLRASVPTVIAVGSITGAFVYPQIVSASVPSLPNISASKLISMALKPSKEVYSGTITENGNIGIPSQLLDAIPSSSSSGLTSLLTQAVSGTTTFSFWRNNSKEFRLQVPSPKGENDLYFANGVAWAWDSTTNTATNLKLPSGIHSIHSQVGVKNASMTALTPSVIASKLLTHLPVGATTSVTTSQFVAGRPAYTLVLNTNDPNSLIKSISFAVDSSTGQPVGISVDSTMSSSPAFSVQYQSISFTVPSASTLQFAPPAGATIKTASGLIGLGKNIHATHTPVGGVSHNTTKKPAPVHSLGTGFSRVMIFEPSPGAAGKLSNPTLTSMLKLAGTKVSTSYGTGTVVSTNLMSAFIGSNGTVAVGAVPYSVLIKDLG